ncbi:MAG: tetraacyldisaccharide 4'-kinase [Terriglobales bacterium]
MNPLTGIYAAVTAVRNTLFDRGVFSAQKLNQPVVSIGNLSVGGSGKTPFVIALGELLKARGIPFDVLSRGYGRKTRGVRVVDPEGKAADFGDEPLLIARRLQVPVIVGESRYKAGQLAEQKFAEQTSQPQLHLLDDGFQHRSLARDFDIVLLTERDFADTLLPQGRLREPLSSLQRADAIVLPANLSADHPALTQKRIWRMERNLFLPTPPAKPVVFCGIARPEQFFAQVRAAGITPAAEIKFRDHHAYDEDDIVSLVGTRIKQGADGFLTTEKDAINLPPQQDLLYPLAIAQLRLTLDRPADLVDAILERIAKPKPRS